MYEIIPSEQNPLLREVSQPIPVEEIRRSKIKTLIADMKALLSKEKYGVALAAVQVGEPVRLFVVSGKALLRNAQDESRSNTKDTSIEHEDIEDLSRVESRDQVYINPEIVKISRKKIGKHEGCLSIRGKWGVVPRAEKATIRAFDEEGRHFTRGASGFLAHIFQHEMDHLEGILYTDKATEIYDEEPDDE